ncbi:hypothetical protein [Halomonas sp. H10-9-1]|uniref:hypothetical protein n=1 Tax=Halomonas sp. H10-9-1 TaxID=2950871 RepID=UPI0032DED423
MAEETISLTARLWLPFLATVGASFTVLIVQTLNQYRKEHRQRLYAVGYMVDVLGRIVHSELIIQTHTIGPHIDATERILSGDRRLLELTLDTDEFDILAAGPMTFIKLPDDHKLLIGYDNIKIIQAFDTLLYLNSDDTNRLALRSFVADNLKSKRKFLEFSDEQQADVLNTYWDYLRSLEHEGKRLAAFSFYVFVPMLRTYISAKKFAIFRTRAISNTLDQIEFLRKQYQDVVPPPDFFEQTRDGGIQGEL